MRDRDDVGEVDLARGVVVADPAERLTEDRGVEGEDAGVDLGIARCSSVASFSSTIADDRAGRRRARSGRSRRGRRRQRSVTVTALPCSRVRVDEPLQRLGRLQRHVAVGDDDDAVEPRAELVERALDGVAGARAARPGRRRRRPGRAAATCGCDQVAADGRRRRRGAPARDPRPRPARGRPGCGRRWVQDLGGGGLHPRAAPCRQHDDCGWDESAASHLCSLSDEALRSPAWLRSRTSSFKGSRAAGLPHRGLRGVLRTRAPLRGHSLPQRWTDDATGSSRCSSCAVSQLRTVGYGCVAKP